MVDFKLQLIFTVLAFIKSVNCEFWTSAEANLGYNVQNIDATRKSVIYKNFSLTKIGI